MNRKGSDSVFHPLKLFLRLVRVWTALLAVRRSVEISLDLFHCPVWAVIFRVPAGHSVRTGWQVSFPSRRCLLRRSSRPEMKSFVLWLLLFTPLAALQTAALMGLQMPAGLEGTTPHMPHELSLRTFVSF